MVKSDAESQTSDVSLTQGFEPQEDDEETLWEVIEITGEKPKYYKVRWKGTDPATLKPWAQSWVPKKDCTDDLVLEWKRKQKEKEKDRRKSTVSKRGRGSTASRNLPIPKAQASTSNSRRSTSTIPATKHNNAKIDLHRSRSSVTKSRSTETVTPTGNKLKRGNHAIEEELNVSENDVEKSVPKPPSAAANGKGKKRKIAEADSAHNSANVPNTKTLDHEGDGSRKPPPKKKRKIQVEVVKSEPEVEDQPLLAQYGGSDREEEEESHPIRVARGKVAQKDESNEADQDMDEERMVEDALSERFNSPAPPAELERADSEEDIVPLKPPPRTAKGKSTNQPATKQTGKKPASSAVEENPLKIGHPKGRPKKQQEELSADSNAKPIPKLKMTKNERKTTTKQGPSLRVLGSVVSLTSDSDSDGPPPLDYSATNKYPPPTEERSVVWNGDQMSSAPSPLALRKPKLSPAALDRLAQFDKEVLAEEEEEESQQPFIVQEEVSKKKIADTALIQDKGKGRASDSLVHSPAPGISRSPSSIQQDTGRADEAPTADVETEYVMFKPNPLSVLHLASPSKEKVPSPAEDHTVPKPPVMTTRGSSSVKPASTSTTTTGVSNANRRRKVLKPSSKSYSTDVIPETEAEESQSQELTLPSKPEIDLPVYATLQSQPPSTPAGRSTLKSRMKGRTPSRAPSVLSDREDDSKEKLLRPIRMLSPSVFHPHLPIIPEPEPDSSLPESISEAVDDSFKQGSSKVQNDEIAEDGTMSSIEEFDSPEKQPRKPKKTPKKDIVPTTRNEKESASDIWESEVVQRGQQLAEAAKKMLGSSPRPKKTLDEIRASRNRSGSALSRLGDKVEKLGDSQNSVDKDGDADMVDASTAVVPPASGPRIMEDEDDSMTVEAMEEAYVDLHGGANVVDPILLRHEEEESTQDLMMEFNAVHEHQRGMDLESGWNVEAVIEDHPVGLSSKGKERVQHDDDHGAESMSKVKTHVVGINPTPVAQPSIENADPSNQTRPRSESHASLSRSTKPTSPPLPHLSALPDLSFHLVQVDLNTVRNSLEAKLEEIASLQAQLASERAKNHLLQEEVLRLQPQIIHPNQLEATNNDKERLAELEEQSAQFASEKAEWETERATLRATLESTERGKVDASKDREFFREQYAQASGYVSSVRDENRDLEKRVKIAEEQASSGVALVRATFEARIAELDKNVASWRMMAEFLVEKDKRTGNDDLRRRAAEQPELKRLCREQSEQLIHIQAELDDIREKLNEKTNAYTNAEAELGQWKTETARLNVELNEAFIKLDRIGRGYTQNDSADMNTEDNGHEFVYRCQWRLTNGERSEACREVFSTISDLEQHLFSGGHLHRI